MERLVAGAAPARLTAKGMGTHTAAALLVAAGDNPERLHTEAAFAQLCGVAPVPASSGKTHRQRLNRGGNRAANRALYLLALGRLGRHEPTRAYVARRTAEGLSNPEIIRCLHRFIAREVYRLLVASAASPPRSTGQRAPSSVLVTTAGSLCEPSRAAPMQGAAVVRRGEAQQSGPRGGLDSRGAEPRYRCLTARRGCLTAIGASRPRARILDLVDDDAAMGTFRAGTAPPCLVRRLLVRAQLAAGQPDPARPQR